LVIFPLFPVEEISKAIRKGEPRKEGDAANEHKSDSFDSD
jgi:hypothetical protein